MATSTTDRTHPLWAETALVVQAPDHHDKGDASRGPSGPTSVTTTSHPSAADESDQWVSQALFDCYNS